MIALPCPAPGLQDARHKLQVHRDASSAFAAGALGRARPQQDPPSETSARRHAGTNAAACGGNAGLRLCRPALKAWQKWLQAVPVMNGRCSMKKFSRKAFPKIFDRRTMRALPTTPRCCRWSGKTEWLQHEVLADFWKSPILGGSLTKAASAGW